MKNPTESIYELEPNKHIFETMSKMNIIMVKGIGYVVVSKNQDNPDIFRHMGEAVAKTFEDHDTQYVIKDNEDNTYLSHDVLPGRPQRWPYYTTNKENAKHFTLEDAQKAVDALYGQFTIEPV